VVLPSDNVVGRTFGVMLMSSFVGTLAVTMGLPAQNTGGYTKRSVTVGMAFIGYCVGNIIGPLAWVEGQTPNYISGYTTCLACFGGQWILFIVLRIYWQRQNKKRAGLLAEREAAGTLEEHDEVSKIMSASRMWLISSLPTRRTARTCDSATTCRVVHQGVVYSKSTRTMHG
jgi:hypothetical protein